MFTAIKSKLILLFGGIIGLLLLYISALKNRALRKEIQIKNSVSEAKDNANDAMMEGLENEARKPIYRDYFND